VPFDFVACAAATPAVRAQSFKLKKGAVRKVTGARQHPATIADIAKALGKLLSWHEFSDINMFVDDVPLKNVRASRPISL
jgi:hypothetical protein